MKWVLPFIWSKYSKETKENLVCFKAVDPLILLYRRDIQSFFSAHNYVIGKTDLLADHRITIVLCLQIMS